MIDRGVENYVGQLTAENRVIGEKLLPIIMKALPKAAHKLWHRHPVWFIEGNPIVGFSQLKAGVRLMFWSGADFKEEKLQRGTGKFKDASILYMKVSEVKPVEIRRWLKKSQEIQWDYKNLVKRKGVLLKLRRPK